MLLESMIPFLIAMTALLLLAVVSGAYMRERRARQAVERALSMADHSNKALDATPDPFFAVAATIEDGLLVIDHNRRIRFANNIVSSLLGLAQTDLRDRTAMAALRDYQADQAIEDALQSMDVHSATITVQRSGRTLRLTCRPIGSKAGAVIILRDLTRLTHLERARREMVANVSHELATPLASTRLLVETLGTNPPPHLAQRMLGQIEDELAAMTQLIDELRELSQIESGRLAITMRQVRLAEIVERAIGRIRPQAERRGLTFVEDLPEDLPEALIDDDRIGQVLLNLLYNALKWTPQGGTITVRARRAIPPPDLHTEQELAWVEGTDWIKLDIIDTGIGIPKSEVDRVFERFYKVDRARTRDGGGTGLGLAIAKHLVERHGGRIWVESQEGQGSTFSMLLPMAH